jgi:hypothetical protein
MTVVSSIPSGLSCAWRIVTAGKLRIELSSAIVPLSEITAAGVVSYILVTLIIGMNPNPVFGPLSPEAITAATLVTLFGMAGLVVMCLALARSIESDLKALASFDSVVGASIERLKPKRALRTACLALTGC